MEITYNRENGIQNINFLGAGCSLYGLSRHSSSTRSSKGRQPGWSFVNAFKRSALAVAMAAGLSAAAAEQPELLKSGELLWNGSAHQLAGVRPAGDGWLSRWQEALEYQNWVVEQTPSGLRLKSGKLEMAKLLIAMDAAVPGEDGALQASSERSTIDAQTALSLDGNLYTPVLAEYLTGDGLVIFNTGRGLYCASQGNSAGHPTPEITAVIDSRLVPLDGRSGVIPIEYDLATGIVHVRSSHGDMACGPPDAVRLTMAAPAAAAAGVPAQWAVRAVNHDENVVDSVTINVDWTPEVTAIQASSNCTVSGGLLNCVKSSLAPGEEWEELIDVTASQGALTGSCEGATISGGRVASENCWAELNVASPVWIEAARSGPTQVEPGVPFIWEITLANVGTETAQNVQLMDVSLPGDNIQFIQASGGVSCTATQTAQQTTVDCDLLENIPPGGQETVQLEMRADKVGSYDVQCGVQWLDGQPNEPVTCNDTIEVAIEDIIFQSRFELN